MRRGDAEQLAEPGDMPNPHSTSVDEVDDLRGLSEPQLVWCQHPIVPSECGDITLPAEFGTRTELAAVQQHHRVTVTGLQIAGDQPVDQDGSAMCLGHLIAIGLTGEPTAPTTLSGGAISWNS